MMDIKIESGVEMPKKKVGRKPGNMYPFSDMKVGDSFFVAEKTPSKVFGPISTFRKDSPEWKFTSRTVTEDNVKGVRVWRVK